MPMKPRRGFVAVIVAPHALYGYDRWWQESSHILRLRRIGRGTLWVLADRARRRLVRHRCAIHVMGQRSLRVPGTHASKRAPAGAAGHTGPTLLERILRFTPRRTGPTLPLPPPRFRSATV